MFDHDLIIRFLRCAWFSLSLLLNIIWCISTTYIIILSIIFMLYLLGENTRILCKFVKASQDFPIIMSSFCIGAIACDRFRFIVQNNLPQMTANQVIHYLIWIIKSNHFHRYVYPIHWNTVQVCGAGLIPCNVIM